MPGTLPPPSHTPLAALPGAALDLETTGLDVRRDRVVEVAALAMLGPRILESPRLEQLIDPGVPIPASAAAIHGLRDADVAGQPRFEAFCAALREFLAGRVVIGFHVAYDLALLRHEAARIGVPWHEPPALDVALLLGALEPAQADLGFEAVMRRLGVAPTRRHRALGDCTAAAEAFARLLPRLREADVRTLGEAQALAARRTDLVLRQAEAGWHAQPGEPPRAALPQPVRLDSYVFERRLVDVMSAPPEMIAPDATLREAARRMIARRIGALLVGAPGAAPLGIVTERDLLRATADPGAATVQQAMSTPVESMAGDEMLYRALARMDRLGIRHLCVVDEAGAAAGIVSQRDLLRHRAGAALAIGDALSVATDAAALAAAYAQLPRAAAGLVHEGLGGAEVARVVSGELRMLTGRCTELAAARLAGPAPAPWCLLVLGSGGRGESLLGADQDNALIHAGAPSDDAWFAALGAAVADMLDEAGVPRCPGGVMAANAEWRGTRESWQARVESWLQRARPEDLLHVDIFFDLVPVAGDAALARALHEDAVRAAARALPFVGLLAESVAGLGPLLAPFGRFRSEQGRVDLKRCGLLPVVSVARTLALRTGSGARATPERLRDAAAAGRLAQGDADDLIALHADLMSLVLRQQLADLGEGVRPSGRVAVGALSRDESARVRRGLRDLERMLRVLHAAVAG